MHGKRYVLWALAIAIAAVAGALEFGTAGWVAEKVDASLLRARGSQSRRFRPDASIGELTDVDATTSAGGALGFSAWPQPDVCTSPTPSTRWMT
jgi:hypothetical protein